MTSGGICPTRWSTSRDTAKVSHLDGMMSILADGRIEARSKFGSATNVNGLGTSQHCACFSEIPLDMLDRLVDRRSVYRMVSTMTPSSLRVRDGSGTWTKGLNIAQRSPTWSPRP